MWWKIYFWLTLLLALVTLASLFVDYPQITLFLLFNNFIFYIEILGLFAFLFKKTILHPLFWRGFFWLNIIIDAFYIFYAFFPHTFFTSFLTIFYGKTPQVDIILFADIVIDLPLLYACYILSRGEFYNPEKKIKKSATKKKRLRWGMLQMALWGYSFILTFILFLSSFFLSGNSTDKTTIDFSYITYVATMFAPVFIFWLWILIRYKQYTWNWWRTTLLANALLYSGSLIFGIFSPVQENGSTGIDLVSIFQLLVLLGSFYVFGKEQFAFPNNSS